MNPKSRISLVIGCSVFALFGHWFLNNNGTADDGTEKPLVGFVVFANLGDDKWDDLVNNHLHFCAFDNGDKDFLYVGITAGGYTNGEIELTVDGNAMRRLKVPPLVYRGTMLEIGNVFKGPPDPGLNERVVITRVGGIFQ